MTSFRGCLCSSLGWGPLPSPLSLPGVGTTSLSSLPGAGLLGVHDTGLAFPEPWAGAGCWASGAVRPILQMANCVKPHWHCYAPWVSGPLHTLLILPCQSSQLWTCVSPATPIFFPLTPPHTCYHLSGAYFMPGTQMTLNAVHQKESLTVSWVLMPFALPDTIPSVLGEIWKACFR